MSVNLIGNDIKLMRSRYDEALKMQGIPVTYQYPNLATSNNQGESVVDSYSDYIETFIFFDGNPKVRTFKRLGWVVENDQDLPFLVHCSFYLPNVQRDSIFRIEGKFSEVDSRNFKVTEITYSLQCPDHIICQVIPVYEDQLVGQTDKEINSKFNKSNYFLRSEFDYRGHYHVVNEDI